MEVKRVLRYLKSTINLCLTYRKCDIDVTGFETDADFANDNEDRKSYTGYVYLWEKAQSHGKLKSK